jgi:putative spermidine/putrescine transport system permease protein
VWIVTALVLCFLVFPILIVIPISFSAVPYLQFPPHTLSLRWYGVYFDGHGWLEATVLSGKVALTVMILATVLGTAAAFALVRSSFRAKNLVYALVLSPLIVPTIITAIAMYFLFASLHLIGNWLGLVLGQTVLAIPLVVVVVSASLSGFDVVVEKAAMGLGASPWTALRRVTLPIIAPGVLAAALLAFLASFDEVVIAIFISGSNAVTLPKQMWDGLWLEITPVIAAASTLVLVFTVLLFLTMEVLRRRTERMTMIKRA